MDWVSFSLGVVWGSIANFCIAFLLERIRRR